MHAAVQGAVWAAWDKCTCAGAPLLATFLSELRVLAVCACALSSVFSVLRSPLSRNRVLCCEEFKREGATIAHPAQLKELLGAHFSHLPFNGVGKRASPAYDVPSNFYTVPIFYPAGTTPRGYFYRHVGRSVF